MNSTKKEQLDNIVSDMLEWVSILTNEVIEEAKKYPSEQEAIFVKGAAWMLYRLVRNQGQRRTYINKDMDLDEAIKHCEEVIPLAESGQCAKEHIQLRNWLIELKNYRNKGKD